MVEILSKPLDIEKIVSAIRETGFPCFDLDVGRDEVQDNKSFFVYSDDGGLATSIHANQFNKNFIVMFVTRENATIDELELIDRLKLCRLIFDSSEVENGQLLNTEESAVVRTYHFHQIIRVER